MLRISLDAAKVGKTERLDGFRRLEKFARTIEDRCAPSRISMPPSRMNGRYRGILEAEAFLMT